jgi:hypothetical protein
MPEPVEGDVMSAVGRVSFAMMRQFRLPAVGSLTDTVMTGYNSGIPPTLLAHFATPGWMKPTGEYTTSPADDALSDRL